jgi:hypothetical protein
MTCPAGTIVIEQQAARYSAVRWDIPALTEGLVRRMLETASRIPGTAKLFLADQPVSPDEFWSSQRTARGCARRESPYFAWARAVQSHDRRLFEALAEALAPQAARRGLPSGPVEAEVFFGDYGCTPGGIHREACSNIQLVLAGTKTMHFWPGTWHVPETARHADTADGAGMPEEYLPELHPARVLDAASSLTCSAGSGFSWSAGTWHVAQTSGPSLALNVAAYTHDLAGETSLALWDGQLHGEVPSRWLAQYRAHTGISGPAAAALARLSAIGMCPARATRTPRAGAVMRQRLAVPVLWTQTASGELLLATLGAVRRLPATTPLSWLAQPMRRGRDTLVPPGCRDVAAWLYEQGVLDVREEK